MKMRFAVIIFLIAFLLQGTLLNLFSIFGATPNLVLCLVIIFSFLYEDNNGLVLGVVFGLLMDLCFTPYMGMNAFAMLIVSLFVSFLRENINKENLVPVLTVSVVATFIFNLIYFFLSRCFGSTYSIIYWLKLQPLFVIYNLVVVFILYLILIKRVVKYRNDRYLIWKKY
ncbi:MAG: rod shape-determining protein MreD [Aminipila sp.]